MDHHADHHGEGSDHEHHAEDDKGGHAPSQKAPSWHTAVARPCPTSRTAHASGGKHGGHYDGHYEDHYEDHQEEGHDTHHGAHHGAHHD